MSFEEKIQSICDNNGFKYFGYSSQDLAIFTDDELEELCANGLIDDSEVTLRKMYS